MWTFFVRSKNAKNTEEECTTDGLKQKHRRTSVVTDPATVRYRHIPTHAYKDALLSIGMVEAPDLFRARIKAAHERRLQKLDAGLAETPPARLFQVPEHRPHLASSVDSHDPVGHVRAPQTNETMVAGTSHKKSLLDDIRTSSSDLTNKNQAHRLRRGYCCDSKIAPTRGMSELGSPRCDRAPRSDYTQQASRGWEFSDEGSSRSFQRGTDSLNDASSQTSVYSRLTEVSRAMSSSSRASDKPLGDETEALPNRIPTKRQKELYGMLVEDSMSSVTRPVPAHLSTKWK